VKPEEMFEKVKKTERNTGKLLPKCLKYFKKIEETSQYPDYMAENIPKLIEFLIVLILIRPFILGLCLLLLTRFNPLQLFLVAEGFSIAWYLIISFKENIWR